MGRQRAEKVGRGKCLTCGYSIIYRKSTGGHLKADCEECEASSYYPPGSESYKKAMATMAAPGPAPEAGGNPIETRETAAQPKPEAPQPAQRRAASVFDLGAL